MENLEFTASELFHEIQTFAGQLTYLGKPVTAIQFKNTVTGFDYLNVARYIYLNHARLERGTEIAVKEIDNVVVNMSLGEWKNLKTLLDLLDNLTCFKEGDLRGRYMILGVYETVVMGVWFEYVS